MLVFLGVDRAPIPAYDTLTQSPWL